MPKTALRFPSLRAIGAIAVAIGVVGAATAAQAGDAWGPSRSS